MGIVYRARDLALERTVAIKLLPPSLAAHHELRERFLREARTAASFAHPHIVPIHLVEAHDAVVFFVMGYIDGETLSTRVARAGALSPLEVGRIVREVAWALGYAHGRGVVHRDIKPDNILIEHATGRSYVTDFGIARRTGGAGGATLTLEGVVLGTVQFMSPEQAAGETLDGRSDIYALGVVAYFAVTGRLPFDAPTAQATLAMHLTQPPPPILALRADLPPLLVEVVDRCLAKEPAARFQSAEELAEALSALVLPAADIAPLVRNWLRVAEQWLVVVWVLGVSAAVLPPWHRRSRASSRCWRLPASSGCPSICSTRLDSCCARGIPTKTCDSRACSSVSCASASCSLCSATPWRAAAAAAP
jgi:serine/threonine-protein kinase